MPDSTKRTADRLADSIAVAGAEKARAEIAKATAAISKGLKKKR